MNFRLLVTVFVTVFIAELGDKTQLATMLFAAEKNASRLTVFAGAALALIAASALGVAAGAFLSKFLSERLLTRIAGIGFLLIGLWTLLKSSG